MVDKAPDGDGIGRAMDLGASISRLMDEAQTSDAEDVFALHLVLNAKQARMTCQFIEQMPDKIRTAVCSIMASKDAEFRQVLAEAKALNAEMQQLVATMRALKKEIADDADA